MNYLVHRARDSAMVSALFAIASTEIGNASTVTTDLVETEPSGVAFLSSPATSPAVLGASTHYASHDAARRELLQEVILALDAGCTLAELRTGIVDLYPDLKFALDETIQHAGSFSLIREAKLYRFTRMLEERLIAEVSAIDCSVCSRRPVPATSSEVGNLKKKPR